jgi:hypothetical protein
MHNRRGEPPATATGTSARSRAHRTPPSGGYDHQNAFGGHRIVPGCQA